MLFATKHQQSTLKIREFRGDSLAALKKQKQKQPIIYH